MAKKPTELYLENYASENKKLADKYLNDYAGNNFQYDVYSDPVYRQARDAYIRQGQRAATDVTAQAASLTGGYGNSYGATAASEAYNNYLTKANDIIPELQQNAYNRYQNEQNKKLSLAQMYLDLDNQDYQRAADAYNRGVDAYNRELNEAQLAAQYMDYSGLNDFGINTQKYESRLAADQAWEDLQKEHTQKQWEQDDIDRAWDIAYQLAQYGDYSKLEDLGANLSTQKDKEQLEKAMQYADMGDFSLLDKLGIDTSFLKAKQAATLAGLYGTGSSGSGRSSSNKNNNGGNDGDEETQQDIDRTSEVYTEDQMLAMTYKNLGLTPRGIVSSGENKGWIQCSGPDGTYFVKYNKQTGQVDIK